MVRATARKDITGLAGNSFRRRQRTNRWVAGLLICLLLQSCATGPLTQMGMNTVPAHWRSGDAQRLVMRDVLQPGDVLRVQVWRQPEFSGEFAIGPDSLLGHPLYRNVRVGGLRLDEARERLLEFVGTFVQNADLVVEALYPVAVAGEVRQPNLYHVPRGTTVAQAIAQAGGPTQQGRLDRILLQRGDSTATFSLTQQYSQWGTVPLSSGDQLFVARRGDFRFLRDVFQPVTTLALLVLNVIRVGQRR